MMTWHGLLWNLLEGLVAALEDVDENDGERADVCGESVGAYETRVVGYGSVRVVVIVVAAIAVAAAVVVEAAVAIVVAVNVVAATVVGVVVVVAAVVGDGVAKNSRVGNGTVGKFAGVADKFGSGGGGGCTGTGRIAASGRGRRRSAWSYPHDVSSCFSLWHSFPRWWALGLCWQGVGSLLCCSRFRSRFSFCCLWWWWRE